ncbi:hypothetical protein CI610_03603 [invertebrate metagenome]|uniref:Uncharacterized protein n=1 Tax=invertebrate metagenome TaxID=1711999 RepID=A0A2H9T2R0_9ZZZZ
MKVLKNPLKIIENLVMLCYVVFIHIAFSLKKIKIKLRNNITKTSGKHVIYTDCMTVNYYHNNSLKISLDIETFQALLFK